MAAIRQRLSHIHDGDGVAEGGDMAHSAGATVLKRYIAR